jgi:hypothetical protein
MNSTWKRANWAVGTGLVILGLGTSLAAQTTRRPPTNLNFQVRPGITFAQAARASAIAGRAAAFAHPFTPGFNPFFNRMVTPAFPGSAFPFTTPFGVGGIGNPFITGLNPVTASLTSTSGLPGNAGYDPNAALYSNPYSGYNSPYGESQFGGYVRGVADVVSAIGRQMVDEQRARLMRQQVKQEQLETWKKGFDYWLYYRDRMPTAEDDRERAVALLVRRSLNDPPVGEIYSGQSLNTLLDDLKKKLTKESDFRGPPIPVDEDVLGHLNITPTQDSGNPGMLKNEGKFQWPVALRGPQFKEERETLTNLSPAAYEQAIRNRVDPGTLDAMTAAIKHLQDQLTGNIKDLTPRDYAEARRFLSNFDDALTLLRKPNSGDYFSNKAVKGKTIGELVQHMLNKGLRFAPALPGDEPAYTAVHRGLVVYASTLNNQLATERTEKEK